jgi:uroporphyrinogen decarboxylase
MKQRYDPRAAGRFPDDFDGRCAQARERDWILRLQVNGPFWQLREWCGFEGLCILMADEPDFVQEMAEFWTRFVLDAMRPILERVRLDAVLISEDMAYKGRSMISPAMTRRFLKPSYDAWVPEVLASGCPVVDMDSDGCIEELIPIWIESGINCCCPVEVAAHNDIVEFRRRFGRQMAYECGIDKRCIARGGQAISDELNRVVPPLLEDGGFIPGCDHGVPHDVSWHNYVEYARLLAELTGWL